MSPVFRLLALVATTSFAVSALSAQPVAQPPVIFVHGNGDHAGLWDNTIWRFESNGYRRDRLFAVDLPHPTASATIDASEPNRSTPEEQLAALRAFVADVRRQTGQPKVVLIGSSRGGMTIRNFVRFGGGADVVSHVITCGTPNHGVMATAAMQLRNEFNGAGAYLQGLNRDREVVDGVQFLALRSDSLDKYAQADGAALGMPGTPTGIDARGPELRGATNLILPGTDHREVAFGPSAFAAQYRFITGRSPSRLTIVPEARPALSGRVSLTANGQPTNVGVANAVVTVYTIDAASGARRGMAAGRFVSDADGRWGPFRGRPDARYEFEVTAPDSSVVLHLHRAPFPRSSRLVNVRLPIAPSALSDSTSLLVVRPRGYFGLGRDSLTIDGQPARGVPPGVPTVDRVVARFPRDTARTVTVRFFEETHRLRLMPTERRHLVVVELQRD